MDERCGPPPHSVLGTGGVAACDGGGVAPGPLQRHPSGKRQLGVPVRLQGGFAPGAGAQLGPLRRRGRGAPSCEAGTGRPPRQPAEQRCFPALRWPL